MYYVYVKEAYIVYINVTYIYVLRMFSSVNKNKFNKTNHYI